MNEQRTKQAATAGVWYGMAVEDNLLQFGINAEQADRIANWVQQAFLKGVDWADAHPDEASAAEQKKQWLASANVWLLKNALIHDRENTMKKFNRYMISL